jgi:hypothetical protein
VVLIAVGDRRPLAKVLIAVAQYYYRYSTTFFQAVVVAPDYKATINEKLVSRHIQA